MTVRGLLLLAGLALLLSGCGKQQSQPSRSQSVSNAELQGEWLYDNNCAECHENPQPDLHKQPPNLHGLFRRTSLPSGAPVNDAEVRKTIIEGRGTMPAFDQRLRKEDVDDLISYLRKLN